MMARDPATAKLFEERVVGPDIARSHPGKIPSGVVTRFEDWLWSRLAYFL